MRVSTSQIYNIANIGMSDAQAAVDQTNAQISSGKRILSPADDPVAATSILTLNQELSRTTQYNANISSATNNLSLEDTTLQSVTSLMQRLKELAIQAGSSAVLTPADYKSIAAEVDSSLSQLTNLQNTRNASGQYIFAGFQSQTQPFVSDGGGNFSYQGDEGQLRVQASTTVTVAVSDSGKSLFMDIPSSNNTFNTKASPTNKATPPAIISVGDVVDQTAFDKLYPSNMIVTFNANSVVNPPSPNYTVTDSSGKILADKQVYMSGQDIVVNGAKFSITGSPYSGVAATPATVPLGTFTPTDFSTTNGSIDVTVGGVTETLKLDQNITTNSGGNSLNDLLTQLGGATDPTFYSTPPYDTSSAAANYKKLQNLGITLNASGFSSPTGLNITVKNGTAATDAVTGITTQSTGTTSANGVLAQPGDKFIIESTNKQGLLTTVSRFSAAMKNVDGTQASKDALSKVISQTLANLDNAVSNISSAQSNVGARQNMLDSSKQINSDVQLSGQKVLSQLQDLDYAEAATRLQMQSFVLSAAQQSFVKISDLSLFKYM